ncbi:eukaryotic translation initiation factor 2 beta subunit [Rhizodiscina lignyota]|uniref:Eukaryotic translation initiation factor 2 beta subunit n=1 Tax=Rhizodiscina lignyota TaxID=1504668 RepID=A0A9P4ICV1_9PEZI|nr:eukaryotic translation initiation factor 2 beta subunit [Rhizodiscina lignyota]
MAEVQAPDKPRKSVSFDPSATVVDEFGEVEEVTNGHANAEKDTAESHSAPGDKEVEEVTDSFKDLMKKKKKKSKTPKEGEDGEAPAADGEFDPSMLKKKKKKKTKTVEEEKEDFEAKLAEAGAVEKEDGEEDEEDGANDEEAIADEGDWESGTGIWGHDSTAPIPYTSLLHRFFEQLHKQHPDLAGLGSKSYKIPPPQCLREGNKKTIFANIAEICKRMKRTDEHVTQFLFAELGTSGSVDGSRRLVIKGRFQQKQIENILRRYIVEYVTCKTCRSPDTELSKGENRLYFVTCNSCGSRRSVQAIKTGFSAQVGKRKRQQG